MTHAAVLGWLLFVGASGLRQRLVSDQTDASANAANPIRKVVNMLQMMQSRVAEEGKREKELYDKFVCYCQDNDNQLEGSVAAANAKIPAVQSDLEAAQNHKVQLDEDLKQHQADRTAAKEAMKEAAALRAKEHASFSKEKGELDANIESLGKAIAAISRGMAGGFLQTPTADKLRKLVASASSLEVGDDDRSELLAFLSGTQGSDYVPQSGQISGILQQMKDEMDKSRSEAVAAEEEAVSTYEALMASKKKEINALTKAIEDKSQRAGDLAVQIVHMKNDLKDTQEALADDQAYLADLQQSCKTKTAEWEERSKTRADELAAIAQTINILNNDASLDMFKNTLPSTSLVQVRGSSAAIRQRALAAIAAVRRMAGALNKPDLDFIALAIGGQKVGLDGVVKMIDNLIAQLKKEQTDDDNKKSYCGTQLDTTDDKKKELEHSLSDQETAIADGNDRAKVVAEDIKTLEAGIHALEASVKTAGDQRKAENAEYQDLMGSNGQAKEILNAAINRLNKFYNPKLHKPEPKAVLLAQRKSKDAPPPPPETFGAYEDKSQENGGVVAMIKLLIADLDKEMTEAATTEKDSQKDYEAAMRDAAETRRSDESAMMEKKALEASVLTSLEETKEAKAVTETDLAGTTKYLSALHAECDWLLKFFDVRKEARAGEVDALANAKAILRGADFSLIQAA